MIPSFDANGNLPRGIHWASWNEFISRFGWNMKRRQLLAGMENALVSLKMAGCRTVYIDGSFVTSKEDPNDYDSCLELNGDVNISRLDPAFLPTRWGDWRQKQKLKWGGEFFIANHTERMSGQPFLRFFQTDREGNEKGIVALDLSVFP